MRKNRERRSANVSLIFLLLGIAMVAAPFAAKADMMEWGFASIFIGGFIVLVSFVCFLIFNGRAIVQSKILRGENILVHWQYDPDFWSKEIAEDIEGFKGAKIIGTVLGGIFALIGIIFLLSDPDDNQLFFFIMLGIGVFIFLIAVISSSIQKRRLLNEPGEAIIVRDGLYYRGVLVTWSGRTSVLEGVSIDRRDPSRLLFAYRYLSGSRYRLPHMHPGTVSIPIPYGQEQAAYNIVGFYNMPLSEEKWKELENEEIA